MSFCPSSEAASVIKEILSSPASQNGSENSYLPQVKLELDLAGDRLGIQVFFDEIIQEPFSVEEQRKTSARALDNLLLKILEDEGNWDEAHKRWYVNSSSGIALVFGLISEYSKVVSAANGEPIRFSKALLEAKLSLRWLERALEMRVHWLMPNGGTRLKQEELLGSGPYWLALDNTIYQISSTAARIAALFPYSPTLVLTRAQLAPILEVLQSYDFRSEFLEETNKELRPFSEIKDPTPVLDLQRRELDSEHFTNNRRMALSAALTFEYPNPPSDENRVYLANRNKEKEYAEVLLKAGFELSPDKRHYEVQGDRALDLLSHSQDLFAKPWKVVGLDNIKKSIRLADARISVALLSSEPSTLDGGAEHFDCQIALQLNNAHVPISTLFKSNLSDQDRWLRLDNGSYLRVPGGSMGQLKTVLGLVDLNFRLSNKIKARLNSAQAISLMRLGDSSFEIETDRALKKLAAQLDQFSGIKAVKVSKNFRGSLRSYQAEGLNWLFFLHSFGLCGILADEMGLGKTVQTLAFLQTQRDKATRLKQKCRPALVVAPTSVIMNWWYEAQRFTPKLKCLLLHGSQRRSLFSQIAEHDLVLTSYALLRMDRYELERYRFGYLILDEAQRIKNFQAATTIAAKNINSAQRLALSGTPTENRPMELWSIMDFLMPGFMGGQEFFRTYFEKPILEGTAGTEALNILRSRTKPFILRRTKQEVEKELPPKIETVIHAQMTPEQRELYSHILDEVRPKVFDAVEKRGVAGASVSILAALLRLRQVCNHPNSISALKDVPGYSSGKFIALKELLDEALQAGRKVLLFAQFLDMLNIIRGYLEQQNVSYLYLDGASKNRQDLIDQFNRDETQRLFLISLKAGGLGLNLTSADMVILYDPWWNPAVESQAIDRAHRIGQRKTVYVYRLITEDSIEQKIMDLKRKKTAIVDALINEQGVSTLSLSKMDLENLFRELPAI